MWHHGDAMAIGKGKRPRLSDGRLKRLQSEAEVVREESFDYYRSLELPELKSEIGMMIKSVEGGLGRVNKIMRGKLIAALEILRQRVHHGEWEKFLKDHRLNPSTVRNWRARGRSEAMRLRQILGESSFPRVPRRKEPPEYIHRGACRGRICCALDG